MFPKAELVSNIQLSFSQQLDYLDWCCRSSTLATYSRVWRKAVARKVGRISRQIDEFLRARIFCDRQVLSLLRRRRLQLTLTLAIASTVVFMIILPQALAMLSSLRASRRVPLFSLLSPHGSFELTRRSLAQLHRNLFRRLLLRVVQAPLRWIDSIPLGTVSNRFTNDVAIIDDSLAVDFSTFAHQGTSMAVALLAGGFILPSAVVPTLLFAAIYAYTFRNYLCLNRDANRIASTTASPLFASEYELYYEVWLTR